MAEIIAPPDYDKEIDSVHRYLEAVSDWHQKHSITEISFLSEVWFRGHGKLYSKPLRPGVYRDNFLKRAEAFHYGSIENRARHMERRMLDEFRSSAPMFFNPNNVGETYLTAQHYGMPTRLLDWTTNALAALFFALENPQDINDDGEVFIMRAKDLLPPPPAGADGDKALWGPVSIRHPYAADAIGESFWHQPIRSRPPLIIPLRPDNQSGRIGQQSSCFTLHMHEALDAPSKTLAKFKVRAGKDGDTKRRMLEELHRLNINQFTIFNDLDHLSRDIKRAWCSANL